MLGEISEACNADDRSPQLYLVFKKFVATYIREDVLQAIASLQGGDLLLKLVSEWEKFTKYAMLMSRVFNYVDKNYLKGNSIPSLGQVCQNEFRDKVVNANKDRIVGALL